MKWLKQFSSMLNDLRDSYGDGAFFFLVAPYGFLAVLYLLLLVHLGI